MILKKMKVTMEEHAKGDITKFLLHTECDKYQWKALVGHALSASSPKAPTITYTHSFTFLSEAFWWPYLTQVMLNQV